MMNPSPYGPYPPPLMGAMPPPGAPPVGAAVPPPDMLTQAVKREQPDGFHSVPPPKRGDMRRQGEGFVCY